MILNKIVFHYFLTLLTLFVLIGNSKCSIQGEQVTRWAEELGNSLWDLGKAITNLLEIKETYKHYNAQVESKDPKDLLKEIRDNIYRMMDRKMDAIRCIQQKAEEVSEFFEYNNSFYQYYSSKYSPTQDNPEDLPKSILKNKNMYLTMNLNYDTHFYNIAVNTSNSSVHVPTNVYDKEKDAAFAIQWSEYLDEVFVRNYNSDPALSWQYFGSSSGIMRHYPAKKWEDVETVDLFDCRIRTWFIEAATCTKDVVILIDNSGSMDGMGKHIAALTAYSILDTFSNNDYVNVLNYSETTNYSVPCFEKMLVQATRENIEVFKNAIQTFDPDGKTRLEHALEEAFNLLNFYREKRKCNELNNTNCNQAIMIITDGISGNLSKIILKHNNLHNGTNIPVRLFTYLIGKEVTNKAEIQWIACANRGYHAHVQSLEQVTASVFQYINVIARPLVLQNDEHPVSWTHAYIDLTYDDAKDNTVNEPYRLLTSAAIPCFDKKTNRQNDTRTAYLLGVAATDVPIDDFRKLTFPYKIGVGGYAFMVSNNGYVLMHPDLRPVFQGILKQNYNSVDISEVEQIDDGKNPREIGKTKKKLRASLVNGLEGSMHNITLKYHFNDMKRISKESYDYYFTPLEGTPFSLAIALPGRFGNFSLKVPDVISQNKHTGTKLTNFFRGNWKIHPKWVYCKYHYLEGHEFDTPEDELVHFLGRMYDTNFKWERQYESSKENEDLSEVECGRKTLDTEDYYCDRQLMQRLIFDARTTLGPFKKDWIESKPQAEQLLINRYNVTLRFVATMSGLTRWDYVDKDAEVNAERKFGDLHARATDETWYKSAVLQRQYHTEAFVYSVPFDVGESDNTLVTGSHAIFASDAGIETPGSVVGHQFSHKALKARAMEVSTKLSNLCSHCGRCNTTLDCYIVDSSGYILLSLKEQENDTGKFFGEKEGDIFQTLLDDNVFEQVIIYDLQALCKPENDSLNAANILLTPIDLLNEIFEWFCLRLLFFIELYSWGRSPYAFAQSNAANINVNGTTKVEDEDLYFACEKEIRLYRLDQHRVSEGIIEYKNIANKRSFYVKAVPKSNLIFIAINNTMNVPYKNVYTTVPQIIEKGTILACQKRDLNELPRRRLTGCFNEHPLEHEINECGKSNVVKLNVLLLLVNLLLMRL